MPLDLHGLHGGGGLGGAVQGRLPPVGAQVRKNTAVFLNGSGKETLDACKEHSRFASQGRYFLSPPRLFRSQAALLQVPSGVPGLLRHPGAAALLRVRAEPGPARQLHRLPDHRADGGHGLHPVQQLLERAVRHRRPAPLLTGLHELQARVSVQTNFSALPGHLRLRAKNKGGKKVSSALQKPCF